MSWWIKDQVSINEDGDESLCEIECDDATSLPAADQTATAGFTIVRGSSAKDIATGDKYIMGSTGTWVKQPSEFQLDLAGYATENWVEDELTDYVKTATYSTDQQRQDAAISAEETARKAECAVLAEAGQKNAFDIDETTTTYSCTYTHADNVLEISGTAAYARVAYPITLPKGQYIFTATVDSVSTSARVRFNTASASGGSEVAADINFSAAGDISRAITLTSDTTFYIMFYSKATSGSESSSATFSKIMVRRAEITDDTYAPYAPTNRELYEMILALQ